MLTDGYGNEVFEIVFICRSGRKQYRDSEYNITNGIQNDVGYNSDIALSP